MPARWGYSQRRHLVQAYLLTPALLLPAFACFNFRALPPPTFFLLLLLPPPHSDPVLIQMWASSKLCVFSLVLFLGDSVREGGWERGKEEKIITITSFFGSQTPQRLNYMRVLLACGENCMEKRFLLLRQKGSPLALSKSHVPIYICTYIPTLIYLPCTLHLLLAG